MTLTANGERLLTMKEVQEIMRVSRNTVYVQMRRDPTFPKPVRIGGKAIRWRMSEVEEYLAGLSASR